jgi:hypothetical protein
VGVILFLLFTTHCVLIIHSVPCSSTVLLFFFKEEKVGPESRVLNSVVERNGNSEQTWKDI